MDFDIEMKEQTGGSGKKMTDAMAAPASSHQFSPNLPPDRGVWGDISVPHYQSLTRFWVSEVSRQGF